MTQLSDVPRTNQRAPDLGVFVVYYNDMGNHITSVHKNLTNAVAAAAGYFREIGFMRYDTEDIEPIQADPA